MTAIPINAHVLGKGIRFHLEAMTLIPGCDGFAELRDRLVHGSGELEEEHPLLSLRFVNLRGVQTAKSVFRIL